MYLYQSQSISSDIFCAQVRSENQMPPRGSKKATTFTRPFFIQLPSAQRIIVLSILVAPFLSTLYQTFASPRLFLLLTIYFAFINSTTFLIYVHDKRRSRIAGWRVKETTLHLFSLLGGWPAAFLAMGLLRHKTRKIGFLFVFWGSVALWLIGWWKLYAPWSFE
jgi:uncharacterized membrane protein YsdA (DUF1294 family)